MGEDDTPGMEQVSGVSRKPIPRGNPAAGPIERVARKRMPRRREMNADLVWPSRFYGHFHERGVRPVFKDPDTRQSVSPAGAGGIYGSQPWVRDRPDRDVDRKARVGGNS